VIVGVTLGVATALGTAQEREAGGRIPHATPDFGLAGSHYVRIGAAEFVPDQNEASYSSTWDPEANSFSYRRYWTGQGYAHFLAWAHLPGGTLFDTVTLYSCDTNPDYALTMNLYSCDELGNCDPTPLASIASTDGCGSSSVGLSGPPTVDNDATQYLLDVVFPGEVIDGSLQLGGALLGWRYQVSPAPAQATFNDVPTSHPFFQFIEALAASEITVGCHADPPLYCPDAPLTRGQMAVFMAKALGLFWPGS